MLWLRWVAANAVGEMLGLGATFALTAFVFLKMGHGEGAGSVLLGFGAAVAGGAIEATVVRAGASGWEAEPPGQLKEDSRCRRSIEPCPARPGLPHGPVRR
ncbi:MAG TPA: hypothetical protein VIV59_03835 [Anaeromyxobacteraceae bacterium]